MEVRNYIYYVELKSIKWRESRGGKILKKEGTMREKKEIGIGRGEKEERGLEEQERRE